MEWTSDRCDYVYRVEQKKTLLSSVTHVPSGLMSCASAALGGGWEEGGKFKHARIFFHHAVDVSSGQWC